MPTRSRRHDQLARHVISGEIPGLVALVARGTDVEVDAIGALTEGGPPVERDALFRIASISKPITAAATLIAIEDGKLALDAPIERWLPELAAPRVLRRLDGPLDDSVPAARAITVRDLLAFTLGTGLVLAPPRSTPFLRAVDDARLGFGLPAPQHLAPPDAWIRALGQLPLIRQPGEAWMYNTGTDVLGVLLGRIAGGSFADYLAERIFAPLAMRDTSFWVPPAKLSRFATAYARAPSGARVVSDPPDGQWSQPPTFASGSAGLVSTVDDLLAFSELLLGRGERHGKRLLSAQSVAAMTSDQLSPAQKAASHWMPGFFDRLSWGFGLAVVVGADPSGPPGAYGWDGGLGTVWRADPASGRTTILLTQQLWTQPVPPPVCDTFWACAK